MKVIEQIVKELHETMIIKNLNPQSLYEIFQHIRTINIQLDKKNLGEHQDLQVNEEHNYKIYTNAYHKKCHTLWRPEEIRQVSLPNFRGLNSGCVFWGPRGVGKSQVTAYAAAWAHESSWAVITIPRCEHFTDGTDDIFRFKNGLYLQKYVALRVLRDIMHSNEKLLSEADVNLSLYGKMDITGVRDGDPEPCPRVWDELKQCWSDSWKDILYEHEAKELDLMYEEMNQRLGEKLPEPKKLIDIAKFGMENHDLATCAIAEILEQLYHNDKFFTMIVLDGYNDFFKPSEYLSFRYDNDNKLRGRIPPQDLALVRLFMRFDGHLMRNGVKIASTTHYRQFNHLCTPDMINLPDGYHASVDNLALNDFRRMVKWYYITGWMPEYHTEPDVESLFMECQGNWWAFHETMQRYKRLHF